MSNLTGERRLAQHQRIDAEPVKFTVKQYQIKRLEYGLSRSKYFVFFIGSNGTGNWHAAELNIALQRQIQERRKYIIPVLLPDAVPETLKTVSIFLSAIQALPFNAPDDLHALKLLTGLLQEATPPNCIDSYRQTRRRQHRYARLCSNGPPG